MLKNEVIIKRKKSILQEKDKSIKKEEERERERERERRTIFYASPLSGKRSFANKS